jgi:hypothetical protein
MYIKLPMYLFFYVALGLNDLDGANPLLTLEMDFPPSKSLRPAP